MEPGGSDGMAAQYGVVGQLAASIPASSSASAGARTDNYDVLSTLGRGTYGVCYKVCRKDTGQVVVMKAVSLAGLVAKDVEDTLNEARLMHRLSHPNLIRHIDSWCENQWLFIVMEYAEEGDLGAVVTAGRCAPEATILRYAADVALGLAYLHANRVLHRDIKPSNIFLVGRKAVIADLGLGRLLSSPSALAYSKVGTPLYFSPELCEEKPYDEKSDVWAFGCLIYELTAGRPPFTAANQVALARKVVHEPPPPLPPQFSRELGALVASMLQKDPRQRPSVADILEQPLIRSVVEQMAAERRGSPRPVAPPPGGEDAGLEAALRADYEALRQQLESQFQNRLLTLERNFQQRVEAAVELQRRQAAGEQQAALEAAEAQIQALQEQRASLQDGKDRCVAELELLRDREAQQASMQGRMDEAMQQLVAKLVSKEADGFQAAEEAEAQRRRAEALAAELADARDASHEETGRLKRRLAQLEDEAAALRYALEQSYAQMAEKSNALEEYERLFSMLRDESGILTPCRRSSGSSGVASAGVMASSGTSRGGGSSGSSADTESDDAMETSGLMDAVAEEGTEAGQAQAAEWQHNPLAADEEWDSRLEGSSSSGHNAAGSPLQRHLDEFVRMVEQEPAPRSALPEDEPQSVALDEPQEVHVLGAVEASLLEAQLAESGGAGTVTADSPHSQQSDSPPSPPRSASPARGVELPPQSLHLEPLSPAAVAGLGLHLEELSSSTWPLSAGQSPGVENPAVDIATLHDDPTEGDEVQSARSDAIGDSATMPSETAEPAPVPALASPPSPTSDNGIADLPLEGSPFPADHALVGGESVGERSETAPAEDDPVTAKRKLTFFANLELSSLLDNRDSGRQGDGPADRQDMHDDIRGSSRSNAISLHDASYDELLLDGELVPTPVRAKPTKPPVRSGDAVEPTQKQPAVKEVDDEVFEVAVHCQHAAESGRVQPQRPRTAAVPTANGTASRAAAVQLSPRPMSAALGAIAMAQAREIANLDDLSDSDVDERTEKPHRGDPPPAAGAIRGRSVTLAQLGIVVGDQQRQPLQFPVLLAWQKLPSKGATAPLPRVGNTQQQLTWINKERYTLSSGADAALAVLFRPTGARLPPVRKVMARRGCSAEFVRLDIAPVQTLDAASGWRMVQAVLPTSSPAAARAVRAGNPAGELAEIIIEFGAPNPVDELLVLRSDPRLRELAATATGAPRAAQPSAVPGQTADGVSHAVALAAPPSTVVKAVYRPNGRPTPVEPPASRRPSTPSRGATPQRRPASAGNPVRPGSSRRPHVQPGAPARRASSPVPGRHSTAPSRRPPPAETERTTEAPRDPEWPLNASQIAKLLERVQAVAQRQGGDSSARSSLQGVERPESPNPDRHPPAEEPDEGGLGSDADFASYNASPAISPQPLPVGAANLLGPATTALLRQLDNVGQAAALSQKLIDLVATPTGSPRKRDAKGQPTPSSSSPMLRSGGGSAKGRSPLSPTSRGNVPAAPRSAQPGSSKRRRQGRPHGGDAAVRSSSDALCREAVQLQEKLRAAMSVLSGDGVSPLHGKAPAAPPARRELSGSTKRGPASAPRPRRRL
eukprot:jgi/Tetstr1/454785/TSEL_004036.t1